MGWLEMDLPFEPRSPEPAFQLGRLSATPGVLEHLRANDVNPAELITRHLRQDAGELDEHDQEVNRQALEDGSRILSHFKVAGRDVWLITESEDDLGRRSATTLLFPEEY